MTGETLSFLPLLDAMEHPEWLLKGLDGVQNDCGVYTGNVYRFLEGKLTKSYVEVKLTARNDFVLFSFSYFVGNYGCGHPLCVECAHTCHRSNSAPFLADCIFNVFKKGVLGYDRNLEGNDKAKAELVKLCRKACDRIAREVA